jgi:hypothetical protein
MLGAGLRACVHRQARSVRVQNLKFGRVVSVGCLTGKAQRTET